MFIHDKPWSHSDAFKYSEVGTECSHLKLIDKQDVIQAFAVTYKEISIGSEKPLWPEDICRLKGSCGFFCVRSGLAVFFECSINRCFVRCVGSEVLPAAYGVLHLRPHPAHEDQPMVRTSEIKTKADTHLTLTGHQKYYTYNLKMTFFFLLLTTVKGFPKQICRRLWVFHRSEVV